MYLCLCCFFVIFVYYCKLFRGGCGAWSSRRFRQHATHTLSLAVQDRERMHMYMCIYLCIYIYLYINIYMHIHDYRGCTCGHSKTTNNTFNLSTGLGVSLCFPLAFLCCGCGVGACLHQNARGGYFFCGCNAGMMEFGVLWGTRAHLNQTRFGSSVRVWQLVQCFTLFLRTSHRNCCSRACSEANWCPFRCHRPFLQGWSWMGPGGCLGGPCGETKARMHI